MQCTKIYAKIFANSIYYAYICTVKPRAKAERKTYREGKKPNLTTAAETVQLLPKVESRLRFFI